MNSSINVTIVFVFSMKRSDNKMTDDLENALMLREWYFYSYRGLRNSSF